MTGREHQAHAKQRVLRWLNERLRLGFSEWNAPGYYVEDLLPLLNLADFAVDPEIRTRTAMVWTCWSFDLAQNSPTGAFAGSAGRVYFEGKNCVWEQAVRNPSELLFGQLGHFTESTFAAASIATSPSYRPPDALIAVAGMAPNGSPRAAGSRSISTKRRTTASAPAPPTTWSSGGAARHTRPSRRSSDRVRSPRSTGYSTPRRSSDILPMIK